LQFYIFGLVLIDLTWKPLENMAATNGQKSNLCKVRARTSMRLENKKPPFLVGKPGEIAVLCD